jgi:hypothetical protein
VEEREKNYCNNIRSGIVVKKNYCNNIRSGIVVKKIIATIDKIKTGNLEKRVEHIKLYNFLKRYASVTALKQTGVPYWNL